MFSIPTWAIVILALAAAVCMGISYKKKDDPKFKPLAVVAVIFLIICAYAYIDNEMGISGNGSLKERQFRASAERFNEARIKFFGEFIKSKNVGKIVIVPAGGSDYAKNESAAKQAKLVKQYVGDAEIIPVDYTRTEEEMAANPQPTVEEFNKFFKANKDAKLFIILEQLPMDGNLGKLEVFKAGNKQQVAFLDSMTENKILQGLFKAGKVLVTVTGKAGLTLEDYEKLAPKDLKEAFDARYELVTKENADEKLK